MNLQPGRASQGKFCVSSWLPHTFLPLMSAPPSMLTPLDIWPLWSWALGSTAAPHFLSPSRASSTGLSGSVPGGGPRAGPIKHWPVSARTPGSCTCTSLCACSPTAHQEWLLCSQLAGYDTAALSTDSLVALRSSVLPSLLPISWVNALKASSYKTCLFLILSFSGAVLDTSVSFSASTSPPRTCTGLSNSQSSTENATIFFFFLEGWLSQGWECRHARTDKWVSSELMMWNSPKINKNIVFLKSQFIYLGQCFLHEGDREFHPRPDIKI